ncbi:heme acquisition protein HasA [Franzmannia pantelleriensis]|uniref:Heme acquisition protein HasA n=1 Tax=Franzmannia pantelleriensis TaxID=48727 RepID=A0A1G9IEQ4_9GAMM|nr:heme acquisition protein HasA [Halomonas pantelleriensis]SDL23720.1 heme acquisition protein HasA [Halomonas pantelleriensis]
MSISYDYDQANFPDIFPPPSTLEELLVGFEDYGVSGEHPGNTGGFYTNGSPSGLSGDTYAMALDGGDFAFSAVGDLSYDFAQHALYGTLEELTLGGGLNSDGTVSSDFITFTFENPLTADQSEGRDNDIHDVIWGLMNGSVDGAEDSAGTPNGGGLLAVLDDAGLLDDPIPAPTTGVASTSDLDVALAA